jgi:hypothetical protein
MRKYAVVLSAALLLTFAPAKRPYGVAAQGPRTYFASPAGRPDASGSRGDPLDLATALSEKTVVKAGDTLLLQEGTYKGAFTSSLTGSETQPVTVKAAPGAHVKIDGSLTVQGAWAAYCDFEVSNSSNDYIKSVPIGVNVYGPHTKFIDLVVHDTGGGFGFWEQAVDSEIYGCIIYHTGWQGPGADRGHGHGIYMQNRTGVKRITDNVIFNNFGFGIHAYTEAGSLYGFHIEGNVAFNNGSATRQGYHYDNILVGGRRPAGRVAVIANYTYYTPGKGGQNRLGYRSPNEDVVVKDNYFAGGSPVVQLLGWENVTMTGNVLYGAGVLLSVTRLKNDTGAYSIDHNNYYGGDAAPFRVQNPAAGLSQAAGFSDWQKETGFDDHSTWTPGRPPGLPEQSVIVRRDQYEAGKGHIIVYNWERHDTVAVDLRGVLSPGSHYEIRNVLDYYGSPAASGTYAGQAVLLPMSGTETGPEFNVFEVVSRSLASDSPAAK